jgi:hypothetical protein
MVINDPTPGPMCQSARNCGNTADAENHVPMHKIDALTNAPSARHRPAGSACKLCEIVALMVVKERAS